MLPTGVSFFAAGVPQPKGSARAFYKAGMKRAVVVQDNRDKGKSWQGVVSTAALEAGVAITRDPVSLELEFIFPRPKKHYRTGKKSNELRPDAPEVHNKKPDVDKLARSVLDALTGIAYEDDQQVHEVTARKRFLGHAGHEHAGCRILVRRWA